MRNEAGPRSVDVRSSVGTLEKGGPANDGDVEPSLWQIVLEDYVAHGREASRPGFQALLVYRFGVARMRVKPLLLRAPLSVLYRAMYRAVRNFYGIELPYTAQVGRRVIFEHQHGIVVHGATVIGDDCIIRHGVTLGIRSLDRLADAPVLGKRVNVGAGAKIIGHVQVGDGAAIGANAVVLEDVPAGRLAVGVPAHLVEERRAQLTAAKRVAAASGETRVSR
jgi:serine O-acetyltransferase